LPQQRFLEEPGKSKRKVKSKAFPRKRMWRPIDDGGDEAVGVTRLPHSTPQNNFLLLSVVLISVRGLVNLRV
jgi:hypothetical protein